MVPLKRRKLVSSHTGNAEVKDSGTTVKFPQIIIFLVERKMGASRRVFLSQLGRIKGFKVEELYRYDWCSDLHEIKWENV